MHGDHVGDRHMPAANAGECAAPDFSVLTLPNANSANIALVKHAAIVSGSEMPKFFSAKLKAVGGDPKQSKLVRFGASIKINGVSLTTVPAAH